MAAEHDCHHNLANESVVGIQLAWNMCRYQKCHKTCQTAGHSCVLTMLSKYPHSLSLLTTTLVIHESLPKVLDKNNLKKLALMTRGAWDVLTALCKLWYLTWVPSQWTIINPYLLYPSSLLATHHLSITPKAISGHTSLISTLPSFDIHSYKLCACYSIGLMCWYVLID